MGHLLSKIGRGFRHRGVQVLVTIALYLLLAHALPLVAHQGLYTISVCIKDLLVWMLPVTVCLFIAHTICSFHHRAPLFVVAIILFETASNFSCVWYAFFGGQIAADYLPPLQLPSTDGDFSALWRLPVIQPAWWSADKGTLLGLLLGAVASVSKHLSLNQFIHRGKQQAQWVLTRIFSRLIPLFVLGYVARMHRTGVLQNVFSHYGVLLLWLLLFLVLYILFLFLIGSGSSPRECARNIKNLLPAGGLAFTSGCSLSTMPWTIEGTAKNLQNPEFAQGVIPATTNIQQIGDCIVNCFLCFLLYTHFFGHSPDLLTWMNFSLVFVLARFATAAVLGGAMFIMFPIYETYLGFTPEMIAIILAFNVVLDPIVTCSNVIANGALCRIFEKGWLRLTSRLASQKF